LLNWNGDLDNPNQSEDECDAEDQSDIDHANGIRATESQECWVVSATPNVARLIWPIQRSIKEAEKWLMTISAMETRSNKENKTK
jgi:hypothetical protein